MRKGWRDENENRPPVSTLLHPDCLAYSCKIFWSIHSFLYCVLHRIFGQIQVGTANNPSFRPLQLVRNPNFIKNIFLDGSHNQPTILFIGHVFLNLCKKLGITWFPLKTNFATILFQAWCCLLKNSRFWFKAKGLFDVFLFNIYFILVFCFQREICFYFTFYIECFISQVRISRKSKGLRARS